MIKIFYKFFKKKEPKIKPYDNLNSIVQNCLVTILNIGQGNSLYFNGEKISIKIISEKVKNISNSFSESDYQSDFLLVENDIDDLLIGLGIYKEIQGVIKLSKRIEVLKLLVSELNNILKEE